MKPRFRIDTPAKLNLRLKVTGRRPDGYHDLVTVMVPVAVFDHLEVGLLPSGETRMASAGFPVPVDASNLVLRAAEAFLAGIGKTAGLAVRLRKGIPVAAGMGGGSSDAAAMLLLLNEAFGRPLSGSGLHRMAAALGADVPFFLSCRPAVARGIGDVLEPLSNWPRTWFVTVTPPLPVSTAWVYGNLRLKLTAGEYEHTINILKKKAYALPQLLENDLEEVTAGRYPVVGHLKDRLLDAGAEAALMTGSGPTVFGLFSSRRQARSAARQLTGQGFGSVFFTQNWERAPGTGAVLMNS